MCEGEIDLRYIWMTCEGCGCEIESVDDRYECFICQDLYCEDCSRSVSEGIPDTLYVCMGCDCEVR